MTVCFIDNNIILQLAAYDLFGEAIAALNLTWGDLRVLNTAIHVFRGKSIARRYSSETVQRAIAIVSRCQTVIRQPTPEFELLLQVEDIDEGEAALIAATATESLFWLTTGDKRCLEALVNESSLAPICNRLRGRTICLEQTLLKLILIHGVDFVQQRVRSTPDSERAIKISFGWSLPADEESILKGLNSYIDDLHARSQNLLATLI